MNAAQTLPENKGAGKTSLLSMFYTAAESVTKRRRDAPRTTAHTVTAALEERKQPSYGSPLARRGGQGSDLAP